jgi:5-methylcytosine-specific restriction endonuclease McrA
MSQALCSTCHSAPVFPVDRGAYCRPCKAAYDREYRRRNRKRRRQQKRAWEAANRERWLEYRRQWRLAHVESERARRRRYTAENPEKVRAQWQRWYAAHPEVCRRRNNSRRARLRAVEAAPYNPFDIYARDQGRCHLCKRRVPRKTFTLDHLIPLVAGGPDVPENVAIAHKRCNLRRGPGRLPAQLRLVG